jgi:hypothetical protein
LTLARLTVSLGGLALLAGCGASETLAPQPIAPPPAASRLTGLDRVMGQDARALITLFGPADLDVREERARKLQFGSGICILDAYLYPTAKGREPVVTHVDTRQSDGRDIDKASCVAALTRRKEAR